VDSLDENGAGFSALFPHDPIGSTSYSDASSYIVPVTVNSETTYQGISGLSSLAKGVKLEMDLEYGADGTAVATRIAVPDLTATNAQVGELGFVTTDFSEIQIFPRQALGNDDYGDNQDFSVGSAAFLISGQFTNMKSLPFPAKFNASSLAAGQQIFVTSPPLPTTGAQPFAKATSITLVPQTINGTVGATSSSGGFQVYTVTLASYDPISILSSIANQITPPQQQTQLQVYVDGNTQKLNTQALEIGGTLRFTGLLLNDAGTLRMDCSQILDGVSD
jgi:hypothetical protein